MEFIYVIQAFFKKEGHENFHEKLTIAFRTDEEAQCYCDYHSNEFQFVTWHKILLGKFDIKKKRKKKK